MSLAMNIQRPAMIGNLHSRVWFGCAALCVLFSTVGCQSLTTTKQWNWPWESKDKEPQIPDRILPIWTDTIMHQPGKPGIRGFGGRVYFYAGEDTQAIEVDGGLVVYVFDSDKMDPHSPSPEKKYVFTPEHMKNHMSEAPLGKSYSIWLPWDEVGGESRSLTLVTRFEGTKGGVILSQPAVKFLPGVGKKESSTSAPPDGTKLANDHSSVQQAGYQSDGESIRWTDPSIKSSTKETSKRRETQTIDLPPSFYRHLNSPSGSPLADPFQDQPLKNPAASMTENTGDGVTIINPSPASTNNDETKEVAPTQSDDMAPQSVHSLLRYPFRHIPGSEGSSTTGSMETTVSHTRPNRREPMKGGWIEGLPKTPRTP